MVRLPRSSAVPRLRDAAQRRFPVLRPFLRRVDRHGAAWATARRRRAIGPREPAPAQVWLVMSETVDDPNDILGVFATADEASAYVTDLVAGVDDPAFVVATTSFEVGYRWEDRSVRYRSID